MAIRDLLWRPWSDSRRVTRTRPPAVDRSRIRCRPPAARSRWCQRRAAGTSSGAACRELIPAPDQGAPGPDAQRMRSAAGPSQSTRHGLPTGQSPVHLTPIAQSALPGAALRLSFRKASVSKALQKLKQGIPGRRGMDPVNALQPGGGQPASWGISTSAGCGRSGQSDFVRKNSQLGDGPRVAYTFSGDRVAGPRQTYRGPHPAEALGAPLSHTSLQRRQP
jgi:hypothetical protein